MIKYLTFAISISIISWIVGMIVNSILVKTTIYYSISNLNFRKGKSANKALGMPFFKWIVKNTFFKFFNQKIKVDNKKTDLTEIRHEMTVAEISHLIGFVFVTVFAVYKSLPDNFLFGLIIMLVNVLFNLYPSLLQQENKRRIDLLIRRQGEAHLKT